MCYTMRAPLREFFFLKKKFTEEAVNFCVNFVLNKRKVVIMRDKKRDFFLREFLLNKQPYEYLRIFRKHQRLHGTFCMVFFFLQYGCYEYFSQLGIVTKFVVLFYTSILLHSLSKVIRNYHRIFTHEQPNMSTFSFRENCVDF